MRQARGEKKFVCQRKNKTANTREGWENGTPPPHSDFKENSLFILFGGGEEATTTGEGGDARSEGGGRVAAGGGAERDARAAFGERGGRRAIRSHLATLSARLARA